MIRWCFFIAAFIILASCLKFGDPYKGLPPGTWRGVLYLADDKEIFDEKSNGELPFNFEVIYDSPDSFHIVILNGEERIVVDDIRIGVDRRTARDTLWIDFPVYDSHIQAQFEEDAIEGWWVARNRKDYKIRFTALNGQNFRFFQNPDPPAANLTGKWECYFGVETDQPDTSIGEFIQTGNKLTGTFMSPTGDDRYLEGTVSGDHMFLSVFDGSHAYLFEAKILSDGSLTGIYRSGNHFKTYWEGKRNDTITLSDLADPLSLTKMKTEDQPFSIDLKDPDGISYNLSEGPYAGKPKIVQIMGTWCPNCRDETNFLLDYLNQNPDPGFEIIGISFERHTDVNKALDAIKTYRSKMKIPYPIVYGGTNNKQQASEVLPMLNGVIAFPTLLFLDRNNRVVATHTGFSGPATSGYEAFRNEFNLLVESMIESAE